MYKSSSLSVFPIDDTMSSTLKELEEAHFRWNIFSKLPGDFGFDGVMDLGDGSGVEITADRHLALLFGFLTSYFFSFCLNCRGRVDD